MTDASYISIPRIARGSGPRTQTVHLPKPQPFAAPVFIHDCVTPLGGETVLSLLMKKMAAKDGDQP